MRKTAALFLVIFLFVLGSCSSEKTQDSAGQKGAVQISGAPEAGQQNVQAGGSYPLEITPADATRKCRFCLSAKGFELSKADVKWYVNDVAVAGGKAMNEFSSPSLKNGDTVRAVATLNGNEVSSNVVTIRNAPPEVASAKFVEENGILSVDATGTDADGDDVTLSYQWTVNGEAAGEGRQLSRPIKKDDKVVVTITPYDGAAYGRPAVLQRGVSNAPPVITANKSSRFNGSVYTYQVNAHDPDGDTLTYALKSAPAGMTIDPSTGLVRWTIPEDFKGTTTFTVFVTDGNGGEASQSLTIDSKYVKPGQAK